jgi:hypothetical protein
MTKALEKQAPQLPAINIQELAGQIIQAKPEAETLTQLFDLVVKVQEREAERAYNEAMRDFQAECPVLTKGREGHKYKYAALPHIIKATAALRKKHGFSYSFDSGLVGEDEIETTCIITHIGGHSKRFSITLPKMWEDSSRLMNPLQKTASATSYGRRYSFVFGFGIIAEDDNDARSFKEKSELTKETKKKYEDLFLELPEDQQERYRRFAEKFGGYEKAHEEQVQDWIKNMQRKLGIEDKQELKQPK